ncbi:hypothetical protein Tco_1181118 [Tanacetum coccineum]
MRQDDSEIPPLEDIYQNSTDGIFTNSSYDDEGTVADFTNLETVVIVSPIPTSRIISSHPSALILGDPTSAVQTRSKNSDYAGANLDRKSTTRGCQFLGRRLISCKCKKQTIMATSTTEAEYVAAASYKQLANVPVPLDYFPVNALTSKVFSFMVKKGKHFSRKVTPLFASMLVQPTEDEGAPSERPSEAQPTPSPAHTSEVPIEPQTDPSPRPSPSTIIPDSIPKSSGGNLGGLSSGDKSLSGNEGEMTLQSVYDLCLSLCAQVSDQAKEIQHLKAQIKKLKKQAKPVIKHHRAWMQSVSLKQRLARQRSSKKQWVHKESISKQGRKFAKGEPSVQRDPLFDEIPEDTPDHIETENAQDVGKTRDILGEEKENDEIILSTEDVLSTDKEKVSTDKEKVSTDSPIVSTDGSKVNTDKQIEGTDEQIESTDEQRKGTDDLTEEGSVTQTTQPPPSSTIFGDDETIAKVLLNMSQAKAVSREKEKGVELKDIEKTDRPRPTCTRSLLTLKPLLKIDPNDKGKKKIEEED